MYLIRNVHFMNIVNLKKESFSTAHIVVGTARPLSGPLSFGANEKMVVKICGAAEQVHT